MSDGTYWNGKGRYQKMADTLYSLLPKEGTVQANDLEFFRIASNGYYDWMNNGLCNESRCYDFEVAFGFLPPLKDSESGYRVCTEPWLSRAEDALDIIILRAAAEQLKFRKPRRQERTMHASGTSDENISAKDWPYGW